MMGSGLILLLCFVLVIYFTRKHWMGPVRATFSIVSFRWVTSYYTIKGTNRYHSHIIPKDGRDHTETEDGDCFCYPGKEEFQVFDSKKKELKNGFVYYHKIYHKISR